MVMDFDAEAAVRAVEGTGWSDNLAGAAVRKRFWEFIHVQRSLVVWVVELEVLEREESLDRCKVFCDCFSVISVQVSYSVCALVIDSLRPDFRYNPWFYSGALI